MTPRIRSRLTALIAAVLLGLAPSLTLANEQKTTKAELDALSADIQKIKTLLNNLNQQRTSIQENIQDNNKEINRLNVEINSLERRLKEGHRDVKKLQTRQQTLTELSAKQKLQVEKSVVSLYKNHSNPRLKLILNQEDPDSASQQLTYFDYYRKAQFEAIAEYETTIATLEELEKEKLALIDQLEHQQVSLARKRKQLGGQVSERKELLSTLSKRYQSGGKELDQLHSQREQLTEILASIAKRQAQQKQQREAQQARQRTPKPGKLRWPIEGAVLVKYNELNRETQMRWQGMLIDAKPGSEVRAISDGQVIFADWLNSYGLLIIVEHSDDFLSLYAYNQAAFKREGDSVLAGEVIAHSGRSDDQEYSGLYFEIRKNGQPQNPQKWLSK